MKKISTSYIALCGLVTIFMTGCSGTLPVSNYIAQNYVRYQGKTDIGKFTYEPSEQGKVKSNQIQNTAVGAIYLASNVADLVQRATALELEKTGFLLGEQNPLQISGTVLEFKANDLGYSVRWSYSIRYKITRKNDATVLLDKVYTADPIKTGKFGTPADLAPSINAMILAGYDKFIRDEDVKKAFSY